LPPLVSHCRLVRPALRSPLATPLLFRYLQVNLALSNDPSPALYSCLSKGTRVYMLSNVYRSCRTDYSLNKSRNILCLYRLKNGHFHDVNYSTHRDTEACECSPNYIISTSCRRGSDSVVSCRRQSSRDLIL